MERKSLKSKVSVSQSEVVTVLDSVNGAGFGVARQRCGREVVENDAVGGSENPQLSKSQMYKSFILPFSSDFSSLFTCLLSL